MPQITLHQGRKKLFPGFQAKWSSLARSTTPCDPQKVTELAGMVYRNLGLPPPRIEFARSPLEAVLIFSMRADIDPEYVWGNRDDNSSQTLRHKILRRIDPDGKHTSLNTSANEWIENTLRRGDRGRHIQRKRFVEQQVDHRLAQEGETRLLAMLGAGLPETLRKPVTRGLLQLASQCVEHMEGLDLSMTDYLLHGLEMASLSPLAPLIELSEQVEGWFCDEKHIVLVDRPAELHLDAILRLHNPDGAALRYRDGFTIHAIGGVAVPSAVIEHPENITAEMIQKERNSELARVMLLKFGEERYAEHFEPKGEPWKDTQGFSSQLLETKLGGRVLARVRVTNSTPEPDGTHKIYWLRVQPGLSCAHEALAQIHVNPFRKNWKSYSPVVET